MATSILLVIRFRALLIGQSVATKISYVSVIWFGIYIRLTILFVQ